MQISHEDTLATAHQMEKKTQILIAHQKEVVDLDKKKYSEGLKDFAHIFVLLTTTMFEIRDLTRTK